MAVRLFGGLSNELMAGNDGMTGVLNAGENVWDAGDCVGVRKSCADGALLGGVAGMTFGCVIHGMVHLPGCIWKVFPLTVITGLLDWIWFMITGSTNHLAWHLRHHTSQ